MPATLASRIESLERRFAYHEWRSRGRRRDAFFVWNPEMAGDELPGLRMDRLKRVETDVIPALRDGKETAAARTAGLPRVHEQSFWRDDDRPGVLVRVDTLECLSALHARETALLLLGDFESPLIERTDDVGEVAFAGHGHGVILFVRANLVYLLRNADRRAVSVHSAALALDASVVSASGARRLADGPPSEEARASRDTERQEPTVEQVVAAGPERDVTCTFVAPEGELALRGGKVVYEGPRSGLERLHVYERRRGRQVRQPSPRRP